MALRQAVERQAPLPPGARRNRRDPVRALEERRSRSRVRGGCFRAPGGIRRGAGQGRPRSAQPARLRAAGDGFPRAAGRAGVSDPAQGARRRFSSGTAAPVAAVLAAASGARHSAQHHQGHPRLLRFARLHAGRLADSHAGGLRGDLDAVRGALLRSRQGVPDAVRSALRRGRGDGGGQGIRLRADFPRREEQDAAAPDRVLDGRARGRLDGPRRRHGSGGGLSRRDRARRAGAARE